MSINYILTIFFNFDTTEESQKDAIQGHEGVSNKEEEKMV